jgi:cytochrome oxidase Cu insertion factor (SCO1/SenC/PrrC family)
MTPARKPSHEVRWVMLALAALFLSGIVVSVIMVETGVRIGATRNYGELVEPPRPIGDVTLLDLSGASVRFSELKGKWTLLYFGSAECLKPCTEALYKMRQLAAAQGQEAHRLQQVFVVTDPSAIDLLRYTLADYPGTKVLRGTPEAVRALASQFTVPAGGALDGLNRLYVVDPLGNFMMSYPADADPSRMNKDLRLLLRASRIG